MALKGAEDVFLEHWIVSITKAEQGPQAETSQPTDRGPQVSQAGRRSIVLGDFEFRNGRIILRKTGNSALFDATLIREIASWVTYYLVVRTFAAVRHFGRRRKAIWFVPDIPHPRYMVRSASMWAGIKPAKSGAKADAAFFFEDATTSRLVSSGHAKSFNFGCNDIAKSHVASVFERVFGYPLAVDPRTWIGDAVEKGEANGAHDGQIVACPREPRPEKCYQRLIQAIDKHGQACDLRTHCVGGRVVIVWLKRRAADQRFLPPNLSVEMRRPREVFSEAELASIEAFARAMGAHWCGLDILRDGDGRIYVVDVNKTDAGPITALSLRDKLKSTALLAGALADMLNEKLPFA